MKQFKNNNKRSLKMKICKGDPSKRKGKKHKTKEKKEK